MGRDADAALEMLKDRIRALSARFASARREAVQDSAADLKEIGSQIEDCARHIADLSPVDAQKMQSSLLVLLDEVDQTIKVFQDECEQMRRQLTSADQSRSVGAAYRQVQRS